jgi:hypothetical protein
MILQGATEPVLLEVFVALIKFVGAPAATAFGFIWLMRKAILPKANGASQAAQTKEIVQHLDTKLTGHFDQLRRDLSITIQRETENAVTKYLFGIWQSKEQQRR